MPSFAVRCAIFLVGVFAFLQVYAIQAILPVLMQALRVNAAQMGISVGMTITAIALISPVMGLISDRFGRKRLVVGALFGLAIPTFLLATADSWLWLNALRFAQGLCVPAMTVVILAYLGEEFPHATSRLTAIYVAGTVLGGFLGRFLLGCLTAFVGYQAGFAVMAVLTLAGAIWVTLALPPSQAFVASTNVAHTKHIFLRHLSTKALLASCGLGACVLFSLVGCFTFINLHLADSPYRLNSHELANLFSVYLVGVVITPLSSRLSQWLGSQTTMTAAILFSMVGLILTLLVPLYAVIIGLVVMSLGVFVTQAATLSHITSHLHEGRSLGLGLYYMAYYAGGSIGAWLCGVAFGLGAWQAVVALIALVQMIALVIVRHKIN